MALPVVTASQARKLLLGGQGLLEDPSRRATAAVVQKLVERMGFVQVDSINVVERAHHLTLGSRLDGYRPSMLAGLIERKRTLFEHWTHDASVIPVAWFPHWRHRFERFRARFHDNAWLRERLGPRYGVALQQVRERVRREGPVRARDVARDGRGGSGGWWNWTPEKAALEVLWRAGELAIARREGFEKVYDLTERVMPEAHARPAPGRVEHVEWACRSALERLGVATSGEVAAFWRAVGPAESRRWCREAAEEVVVEAVDGSRRRAFAVRGWRERLKRLPAAPDRMRLLSPFDPILRDRSRALRLFGFDYRFEAFVPAARRKYGYYVMPVLEGERLVARVELKRRESGGLEIRGAWWERGRGNGRRLAEAIGRVEATCSAPPPGAS
jgi:hypothetical protein